MFRVYSVQPLSRVRFFAISWIAACQASLSITNSQNLIKLMPVESAMPSSHLILGRLLLLLPPIPPSIRVFSNESSLRMRWPKYWSFSFVYITIYEIDLQSKFDAWNRALKAGALGQPWGMAWGGRWERGSGWGPHVHPWLIHVNIWQKPLQYCKVISLQLK